MSQHQQEPDEHVVGQEQQSHPDGVIEHTGNGDQEEEPGEQPSTTGVIEHTGNEKDDEGGEEGDETTNP